MLVPHPLQGIGQYVNELRLRSKPPGHFAPLVQHPLSCFPCVHTFLNTTFPLGDLHGTLPRALSDRIIYSRIII